MNSKEQNAFTVILASENKCSVDSFIAETQQRIALTRMGICSMELGVETSMPNV